MAAYNFHVSPVRVDDSRLVLGAALGIVAAGGAYLLFRRSSAAGAPCEITTVEDLQQYSKGGALRDAAAWLITPQVTAVRVTHHGDRVPALPPALCSLKLLRELNVASNAISELPLEITRLTALVSMDVSGNKLTSLPPGLGALACLTFLNAMDNQLEELPADFGDLRALRRLGLKSNRLRALPASLGQLTQLRELFLTDNLLEALPAEIGGCVALVKLQASHNLLQALPAELATLPQLELLRVAGCQIADVPEALVAAPALAWLSLATNPACGKASPRKLGAPTVAMKDLEMGRKLGDGASGEVFEAVWRSKRVALKIFRSDRSPDGHSRDEMAVACMLSDRNLVRVLAQVQEPLGLVLEFVEGAPLADKPNAESLLRCRWAPHATFELPYALAVAAGVASALEHMHYRGVAHGDVYAHNVIADGEGNAVLCDYGAAFAYPKGAPLAAAYEGQEVRAFGLLLRDLVQRLDIGFQGMEAALDAQKQLAMLVQQCTTGPAAQRPRFGAIARKLKSLQKALRGSGSTPRSDSRLASKAVPEVQGRQGYATVR